MKRLWWAIAALLGSQAHAAVVLSGTRVVYPEQSKVVNVRLTNEAKSPALVQAWIDTGAPDARPEELSVPFMILPPVFRLDAGKSQTMRLVYTKQPLPQDRESVYWLNVLDIPPKAQDTGESQQLLQIAYRTRIKLFFRPTGLKGSPHDAPAQIKWQLVKTAQGYCLRAENPTPFAVSYAALAVETPHGKVEAEQGMVQPFSSTDFALKATHSAEMRSPAKVDYSAINDYGAVAAGESLTQ